MLKHRLKPALCSLVLLALTTLGACVPETPPTPRLDTTTQAMTGQWATEQLGGMTTALYVPTSAPALAGKRALMVNLHGCAQSADALKNDGNWVTTADAYGMVVAIPSAPNGGVLFGCWDYYGSAHTRSNKHNGNLLALVEALLDRSELNIDPEQVYISGLSSGASQAMVMGCLAPDVFAGIGVNAGPTVGTSSGDIGLVATNAASATALCRRLAGADAPWLEGQLTSIIYGDNDFTVNTGYNSLNAEVMAQIYGAAGPTPFDTSALEGANTAGSGQIWSDADGPRVSLIENTGIGHNWPAGQGGSGGVFVAKNSISYPAYLARFFFENNRRASGNFNPPPDPEPNPDPDPDPDPGPDPDPNPDPDPDGGVTSTLGGHIAAGRLGWDEYAEYFARYGFESFTLYPQPDGTWSDEPPPTPDPEPEPGPDPEPNPDPDPEPDPDPNPGPDDMQDDNNGGNGQDQDGNNAFEDCKDGDTVIIDGQTLTCGDSDDGGCSTTSTRPSKLPPFGLLLFGAFWVLHRARRRP